MNKVFKIIISRLYKAFILCLSGTGNFIKTTKLLDSLTENTNPNQTLEKVQADINLVS